MAHVEAGLRSRDMTMPEEINRLVTDRLSSLLLTTDARRRREPARGRRPDERIQFVGNVMIDTLLEHRPRAPWTTVSARHGIADRAYAVLTLHRPANVDDPDILGRLLDRIRPLADRMPIVFPIHPRTRRRIEEHGLQERLRGFQLVDPLGYLEFLALTSHAGCVLTDSGGIQEETTVLDVPCFTLRDNTERPVTITEGTNTLVGADGRDLPQALDDFFRTGGKRGRVPELWDGATGKRIAAALERALT